MRKVKEIRDPLTDEIIYFKTHAGVVRMNNGMTVEDAVNLMINNHKSEDSEESSYTEDLTIVIDGITEGFIILILSEDGLVLGTQTTNLQTHKINEGVKYYIVANNVEGYITPSSTEVFTAVKYGYREVSMIYLKLLVTTIRINLTISDPAAMITRIVDNGGIEAIRANSHRYTGKFDSTTNVMTLKQLDDSDSTKYLDGTAATLTTVGTDIWMKLPRFFWKCTEYNTDVWDFSVAYGINPGNYNEWDGKDLIGVFEGYVYNTKLLSVKSTASSDNISQATFKTYARNRGNGFTLIKWKHHCMMAMLFYTYYGNTNSLAICGSGTSSYKSPGETASLGMIDTTTENGNSMSINFWGLENWWGNKYEWLDNIVNNSGIVTITEDDDNTRQVLGLTSTEYDYASKLLFGENIDLIPTEHGGSDTTYFCDRMFLHPSNNMIGRRGHDRNYSYGGVGAFQINNSNTDIGEPTGSRLAFRGEIVIES